MKNSRRKKFSARSGESNGNCKEDSLRLSRWGIERENVPVLTILREFCLSRVPQSDIFTDGRRIGRTNFSLQEDAPELAYYQLSPEFSPIRTIRRAFLRTAKCLKREARSLTPR